MKKTLITLTSVVALTGAANAQTTSLITWDTISQPTSGNYVATGSIAGDSGIYTASFNAYSNGATISGTNISGTMGPNGIGGTVTPQNPSSWTVSYAGPNTVVFNAIDGKLFSWDGYTHEINNLNSTVTGATGDWSALAGGAEGANAGINVGYEDGQIQFNDVSTLTFDVIAGGAFSSGILEMGIQATTTSVPEPSSTALLGLGALGLIMRRKK